MDGALTRGAHLGGGGGGTHLSHSGHPCEYSEYPRLSAQAIGDKIEGPFEHCRAHAEPSAPL
jgi:hypothetical protein